MTPEIIAHFERLRFEQLYRISKEMTALGLEGHDPDDPRIALLLKTGLEATTTHEELVEWIRPRKPR